MWTFPVVIDSRPPFLSRARGSLLLAPLGAGTVLSELRARLAAVCATPPLIAPGFPVDAAYERAIRESCPDVEGIEPLPQLAERFRSYDPGDRLLLADPICFPVGTSDGALAAFGEEDDPWCVRHLVALQLGEGRAREYVDADPAGRVRRIQRYYDVLTWPYATGVACTLLPIACLRTAPELSASSLLRLRLDLASRCVPSRDVRLERGAVNLGAERGLLALNEHLAVAAWRHAPPPVGGSRLLGADGSARVHPSAMVVGPVVAQPGVVIEDGATVIGPTVLGARCRVGKGAIVAQCVIGADESVPPATRLRHRVFFGDLGPAPSAAGEETARATAGSTPEEGSERSLVSAAEEGRPPAYHRVKRSIDIAASATALVLFSPLGLVIAGLVKLESGGPVFFGHVREARGGRSFRCWKFRTMRPGADLEQRRLRKLNQVDGPQFKVDNDPRRTRVGRLLSLTSLDEVPQLWNVLVGEMSLVGPRPSPFRENQLCVPWRENRLRVRPGLTGLWQVCRHDRQQGDFHQWIYYDLLYLRNLSFGLDLRIIGLTLFSFARRGNIPLSWLLPAARRQQRAAAPGRRAAS